MFLGEGGLLLSVNELRCVGQFGQPFQCVPPELEPRLQGDEFIGISVGQEGGRDVVERVHACDLYFQLLEGEVGQSGVVLACEFLGLG